MSKERPPRMRDRDYPEVEGHAAFPIGEDGTRAPVRGPQRKDLPATIAEDPPDDVEGHVVELVRRKEDGERR